MNEELMRKGERLVEDLNSDRASLLEEWMAHYIAELMEKVKTDNDRSTGPAAERCANLIHKLWNQKIERDQIVIKNKLQLPEPDFDPASVSHARELLTSSEAVGEINPIIRFQVLEVLLHAEQELLRIVRISEELEASGSTFPNQLMSSMRWQLKSGLLLTTTMELFPAYSSADPNDLLDHGEIVYDCLDSLYDLRQRLLRLETGADSKE